MAQIDKPINALAYDPAIAATNAALIKRIGFAVPKTQAEADEQYRIWQENTRPKTDWHDRILQAAPYVMLGGAALQAGMAGAGAAGAEAGAGGAAEAYGAGSGWGADTLSAMGAEGYGGTFATGLEGYSLPAEFGGAQYVGAPAAEAGTGTLGTIGQGSIGGGELATMGAYPTGTALPATASLSPALSSPSLMSSLGGALTSGNGLAQLGSAAIGLYGNNQAIGAYQDATNQANGLAQQQLDYTKQLNAPLVGLRDSVLPKINALLSNPSSITSDPGYAFGLKQGADQLNNRAAASGSYYSGGQMKAAQRYGQDYASTKLDQSLNRLTNVAGLGQVGANNAQQGFTQGTNALAGNALNMGNARGSLYAGNAQLAGNALGSIFNQAQYRDMWGQP